MRPRLAWLVPGLLQLVAGTATAQQGSAVQLPTYYGMPPRGRAIA